jgi:tetratricopeptide (TPR) repeat protein
LDQGRQELNQNYADNYWDILPVERMQIDQNIILPDSIRNQNFGRAEEKAVKAIQRHSMLIEGKEHNPQIDEAYLLLGKARYFDQRFIPALEAFNYILHKYPASDNINYAQIWREKTNMRLDNNRLAIKNLKRIIENYNLEEQDLADANATLAQAYIKLEHQDSAIAPLQTAAEYTKKNEEKGRYYFILGQLHNFLDQTGRANAAFDEVIALNRKSPRIYMINAYVQKARNFDYDSENSVELRELLTELEEDRGNRPFLDKIYFQIGEYYSRLDSTDLAVEYYNKSLSSPRSDIYLKSINYEILANINFDNREYREASLYFDSTLATMSPQLREFRSIKKKRDNLEDIIQYEEIAEENDSILRIANLSEEDQIAYFTTYTSDLKAAYTEEVLAGRNDLALSQNNFGPSVPMAANTAGPVSNFYFYNESRVANGAREFLRNWGRRELSDNWRWGDNTISTGAEQVQNQFLEIDIATDPRFDAMSYVSQIPSDPYTLDSLTRDRDFAYYQLGIIYNEKYGEYDLASARLEALLENTPEERLILPAKYNLYKAYQASNRSQEMEIIKQDILQNYPESRYAAYLQNPESSVENGNSPDAVYDEVYKMFEAEEYAEVIDETTALATQFTGDEIVPKLELLKAMAIGRLHGLADYKKALNQLALTYPQTEEGKKAQDIYNRAIPQLESLTFAEENKQSRFKLLYAFGANEEEEMVQLKEKIDEALTDLEYDLSTSTDIYNPDMIFVAVHGLRSREVSLGFAELLQINKDYQVLREPITISQENYRIIQIQKNLQAYLNKFD